MDESLKSKLLALLIAEIERLDSSVDIPGYLATQLEELFDQHVKPIDLPGPDAIIDPLLRAAIRPLVKRLYDGLIERIGAEGEEDGA
ncbi:MAG: hypothetical protein RBR44_05650 [Bacilli bacterium]|nr:hypothetical protein [Bacilli bacterium]